LQWGGVVSPSFETLERYLGRQVKYKGLWAEVIAVVDDAASLLIIKLNGDPVSGQNLVDVRRNDVKFEDVS